MAPHSSTLAWKIPWTEESGRLQSMGSLRVAHNGATSLFIFHFHALEEEMATHCSSLAWRIPGAGEPVGLPTWLTWLSSSSSTCLENHRQVKYRKMPVSPIVAYPVMGPITLFLYMLYTFVFSYMCINIVFNFLMNFQTAFYSNCTMLHSHQQCMRVQISPCSCQHLLFSVLFFFLL